MILELTLKKKWFDMIRSGEKKEEYREIKSHWISRLSNNPRNLLDGCKDSYDYVLFSHGYQPDRPQFLIECKGIDFGEGLEEWGAEKGKEYFVIKLGQIISDTDANRSDASKADENPER